MHTTIDSKPKAQVCGQILSQTGVRGVVLDTYLCARQFEGSAAPQVHLLCNKRDNLEKGEHPSMASKMISRHFCRALKPLNI